MARILVVEDEPLIAILLNEWLDELGHEAVGPISCVDEGMKIADAGAFDAALLDINLGTQRSDPIANVLTERKIPFAFMTGGAADSVEERFSARPKLMKPFEFEAMRAVLDALISRV